MNEFTREDRGPDVTERAYRRGYRQAVRAMIEMTRLVPPERHAQLFAAAELAAQRMRSDPRLDPFPLWHEWAALVAEQMGVENPRPMGTLPVAGLHEGDRHAGGVN